MPTRIWDKGYECHECERSLILNQDCSTKTWLCNDCGTPIHIHVADNQENAYTIERKPAKSLLVGDLVLLGAKLDIDYPVIEVKQAGKGQCRLALKNYRTVTVDADKYYSVIIAGWSGHPTY